MTTTDLTISVLIGRRWVLLPHIKSIMGFGLHTTRLWNGLKRGKARYIEESLDAYIECVINFRSAVGINLLDASFSFAPIKAKYESGRKREYYWFTVDEIIAHSKPNRMARRHLVFVKGRIKRADH